VYDAVAGRAFAILRDVRTSDYIFPGGKAGKPLSNMAMTEVLRRMGRGGIRCSRLPLSAPRLGG
jgi:hypothetical protein